MIISWFTQPEAKPGTIPLSSYYQLDTVTRRFVRIRLEIGRSDGGQLIMYRKDRVVGFSAKKLNSDKIKLKDGKFWFDGKVAEEIRVGDEPKNKEYVYDTTEREEGAKEYKVHRGNEVTSEPSLPKNIGAKHLAVLANEAMMKGRKKDIDLATGLEGKKGGSQILADKILERVDSIVKESQGPTTVVDDAAILRTLQGQAKKISVFAAQNMLKQVDTQVKTLNEAIVNSGVVPDQKMQESFSKLMEAVAQPEKLYSARIALDNYVATVESSQFSKTKVRTSAVTNAIERVQRSAFEWKIVAQQHEKFSDENMTLDKYGKEVKIDGEFSKVSNVEY